MDEILIPEGDIKTIKRKMEFKTSEFYVNWWEKISLIDNQLLTIIIKAGFKKLKYCSVLCIRS